MKQNNNEQIVFIKLLNKRKNHSVYTELLCSIINFAFKFASEYGK